MDRKHLRSGGRSRLEVLSGSSREKRTTEPRVLLPEKLTGRLRQRVNGNTPTERVGNGFLSDVKLQNLERVTGSSVREGRRTPGPTLCYKVHQSPYSSVGKRNVIGIV